MKIKIRSILYGLFALTVFGIQLQDILSFFTPAINKAMGVIMAVVLVLIIIQNASLLYKVVNKEIILWILFLMWATLTGTFIAKNITSFANMMFYLAQLTIVIMAAILISVLYGSVNRVLYVVFLVPMVFIIYLFATGQSHYILSLTKGYGSNYLGTILNANTIAFWNVSGIIAYFLFRPSLSKKSTKLFCFSAALLYSYMIVQSGSRKTFLAAILFIALAYLFQRVFIKKNSTLKVASIIVFLIGAYIFSDYILPGILADTYLGQRLLNFTQDQSNEKRIEMILEAMKYLGQSPLWGIGVNQFQHYTIYGYYTHCDIAEVLCSTGLVGGLLYISIYGFCYRKLFKLWKIYKNSNNAAYCQAGIMLAGLTTMLFISIGSVAFESMSHWLMIAAFIGYTEIFDAKKCRSKETRN